MNNITVLHLTNFYLFFRYGNLEARFIRRPDLVAKYSKDSNTLDNDNHLRQHLLGLERKWTTQDGNFRICTGVAGMTVVDVYELSKHHGMIDNGKFYNFLLITILINMF